SAGRGAIHRTMESQSRFGWNCRAGGGEGECPLEEETDVGGRGAGGGSGKGKDRSAFDVVGRDSRRPTPDTLFGFQPAVRTTGARRSPRRPRGTDRPRALAGPRHTASPRPSSPSTAAR